MNKPSAEHISAFVDGELSKQEVAEMLKAMGEDAQLAESACELRNLKLMVRHAYENTVEKQSSRTPLWHGPITTAVAAVLVLAIGTFAGWKLHDSSSAPQWTTASGLPEGLHSVRLNLAPRSDRIILHVDSNNVAQIRAALEEADEILKRARLSGVSTHIEILANNYGLDMMREDRSPEAARIAKLAAQYPTSLRFLACQQSIQRFEREGQSIKLLPAVQVAPTAIGEVITRLKEGWTYVKV